MNKKKKLQEETNEHRQHERKQKTSRKEQERTRKENRQKTDRKKIKKERKQEGNKEIRTLVSSPVQSAQSNCTELYRKKHLCLTLTYMYVQVW